MIKTFRVSLAYEDKLDQEDAIQMRLSTQIQDNARSHTNSTHSLFSPSPLEKRSSTLLLCYSCQCLVFTQPQTNHAHFSPEPNWSSRATGNQCAPGPLMSVLLFTTIFGISLWKRARHRKPQAYEKQDSCLNRTLDCHLLHPLGTKD